MGDTDPKKAVEEIKGAITKTAERLKAFEEEGKTREERVAAIEATAKSLQEKIDQYVKQLPKLRAADLSARDADYGGVWRNADQARAFGLYVMSGLHPDSAVRSACAEKLVKTGVTFRTTRGQFVKGETFAKAMGEGTDALGGYLVPDEFIPQLIRNVDAYGVVRGRITRVPMSRETQTWPRRTGGLTVYHPDEGVAATASDLGFGQVQLTARKWAVLTFFSRELEEDAAIGLGELIGMEMALALAIAEDTYTFQGDGSAGMGTITGILASANVTVVTMGSGDTAFADLSDDDFIDLKRAVPTWVRKMPDAAYYMSPDVAGIAEKIRDDDGRPMYQRATEDFTMRIHGHEVVETLAMPDITDDGISTKFLAFGSLRAWGILGQRRSMSIERNTSVKWLEGQVGVMAVPRLDIKEQDGDAMAVLRTAAA
jgi:HK97 family phage major capsid protein